MDWHSLHPKRKYTGGNTQMALALKEVAISLEEKEEKNKKKHVTTQIITYMFF